MMSLATSSSSSSTTTTPTAGTTTYRGDNNDHENDSAIDAAISASAAFAMNSNSSSSGTSISRSNNPTIVVDAALLRRALRLVYCLQKERGASCCYYASGKSNNSNTNNSNTNNNADPLLSFSVLPARRDTDCAWNMMVACSTTSSSSSSTVSPRHDDDNNNNNNNNSHHHHRHHHHHHHRRSASFQSLYAIQAPLAKIRKMVENGNTNTSNGSSSIPGGGGERTSFHKIFAFFNTLISSVVHEYLLLQTAHQRHYLQGKNKNSIVRSHSSSQDPFSQRQQQEQQHEPPVSILRGSVSSINLMQQDKSSQAAGLRPPQSQHRRNSSEDGFSYFSAMVGSLMLGVDDVSNLNTPPPPPPPRAPPAPRSRSNGDNDDIYSDDDDGVAIVLSDEDMKETAPSDPFEHFQLQVSHVKETFVTTTTTDSLPHQNRRRRAQSHSPSARHATTRKKCGAGNGAAVSPMRRIDSGEIDMIPLNDAHQQPCNNNNNNNSANDVVLGGAVAEKTKSVSLHQEEESPEQKVVHLLDLLDIFIKLKESTGIERATLTSLLAAANAAAAANKNSNNQHHHHHHHQQHDDNDTQFLLADLVLQVENQRSLLQRLRQLRDSQGGSGSLKNLVHDLVSLSPRLAQLQHDLLHGGAGNGSVSNGHHQHHAGGVTTQAAIMETVLGASLMENNNQLWDMLTVYIDKLHSLELLIVEEIECSAAYWMTPSSASSASSSFISQPHAMMMMDSPTRNRFKSPPHSMGTTTVVSDSVPPPLPPPEMTAVSSTSSNQDVHVLWKSFGEFESNKDLLEHVQSLDPNEIKCLLVTGLQQQVRGDNDNNNENTNEQPNDGGGAYSESSSSSRSQSSTLLPLPNDNHNQKDNNGHGNNHVVKEGSESEEGPANRIDDLLKELCHAPSSKEWEIDLYQIRFLKRIGQGSAGTTYLGDWGGTHVAVKVASITEMGLDGWRKEVQALQKLHHPNIIRLLGSVYHPSPLTFCLVLEYCNAGDLSDALLKPTPSGFWSHVAISIAKGITYLHHRGIIHRDIKPCNILLDGVLASGKFSVKVTDFGVATDNSTKPPEDRTAETGTYRWMAPEVIRHEIYTQTADVYSFAILMWQLITRERPYANKSAFDAAAGVSQESARPPFPNGTPTAFAQLIEKCWDDDPQARPQFDAIVTRLIELVSTLTEPEKQFLEAPMGHAVYNKPHAPAKSDAAAAAVSPAGNRMTSSVKYSVKLSSARFEEDSPAEKEVKRRSLFGLGGKGKGRALFNRASNHF